MTRHLILALGLALVAAATALLLADVGVFESPARWLFDAYRSEALWKSEPAPVWPWLPTLAAGLGALLVALGGGGSGDVDGKVGGACDHAGGGGVFVADAGVLWMVSNPARARRLTGGDVGRERPALVFASDTITVLLLWWWARRRGAMQARAA